MVEIPFGNSRTMYLYALDVELPDPLTVDPDYASAVPAFINGPGIQEPSFVGDVKVNSGPDAYFLYAYYIQNGEVFTVSAQNLGDRVPINEVDFVEPAFVVNATLLGGVGGATFYDNIDDESGDYFWINTGAGDTLTTLNVNPGPAAATISNINVSIIDSGEAKFFAVYDNGPLQSYVLYEADGGIVTDMQGSSVADPNFDLPIINAFFLDGVYYAIAYDTTSLEPNNIGFFTNEIGNNFEEFMFNGSTLAVPDPNQVFVPATGDYWYISNGTNGLFEVAKDLSVYNTITIVGTDPVSRQLIEDEAPLYYAAGTDDNIYVTGGEW